jgi:two-component system, chemotaxis family, response regulator Rcp1
VFSITSHAPQKELMSVTPIQILMVEDNYPDVLLAIEALKDAKIANCVQVVDDGVKALEYLRRQGPYGTAPRPDLILLDLNLPRKDGRQVLAEIKSDPELGSIPVVVLTASRADQDIIKSYAHHANCYIIKPVDFNGLMEVVRSVTQFWVTVVKLPTPPSYRTEPALTEPAPIARPLAAGARDRS